MNESMMQYLTTCKPGSLPWHSKTVRSGVTGEERFDKRLILLPRDVFPASSVHAFPVGYAI
jgi:hypothetical protein